MKRIRLNLIEKVSGKRFLLCALSALCLGATTSCDDDLVKPDPIQDPITICPPYDSTTNCQPTTYVTVRPSVCGVGVWGGLWLQLDNGDYLQPWSTDHYFPVQDGQRLKINYHTVTRDSRYDSVITCMALPLPAEPVHITCLTAVQNPPSNYCTITVTADDVLCGYGVWGAMYFKLPDGTHLQPWESLVNFPMLQDGHQYKIGYELMQPDNRYDSINICMALPIDVFEIKTARITCIEAINNN